MEGKWSIEGAVDSCGLVATGMRGGMRKRGAQEREGGRQSLPLCWEQATRCFLPGVPTESHPGPVSSQGPLLSGRLLKAEPILGCLDTPVFISRALTRELGGSWPCYAVGTREKVWAWIECHSS